MSRTARAGWVSFLVLNLGVWWFLLFGTRMLGERLPPSVTTNHTIDLPHPTNVLWSLVSDPRHDPQWRPNVNGVSIDSDQPRWSADTEFLFSTHQGRNRLGSSGRVVVPGQTLSRLVFDIEPEVRIQYRTMTITPRDAGSRLTFERQRVYPDTRQRYWQSWGLIKDDQAVVNSFLDWLRQAPTTTQPAPAPSEMGGENSVASDAA